MARPLGLQPPRLLVTGRLLGHLERWGRCGERDAGAAPGRPAPAGRSVPSGGRIPRPEAGGGPLWQWACGRSPRTLSVRAEDMGEPPMPRGAAGRTGATPVLLSGGHRREGRTRARLSTATSASKTRTRRGQEAGRRAGREKPPARRHRWGGQRWLGGWGPAADVCTCPPAGRGSAARRGSTTATQPQARRGRGLQCRRSPPAPTARSKVTSP